MGKLLLVVITFFAAVCLAQDNPDSRSVSMSIKGQIIDKDSKEEIEGALVELLNFVPRKICQSNQDGDFELQGATLGRHKILVKKIGYENGVVSDVILTAGATLNLEIELTAVPLIEVVDNGKVNNLPDKEQLATNYKSDKDLANNQLAGIAVQPFTVEEVVRYAGSRFDLSRLTNNFAGVTNNYDARNDIVVRGNSPAFLTWQLEELPFDNLNHLGVMGTSGGTTPLINIFALGKADFLKGCFSAQYGNSSAGIFDLSLRKGNSKEIQMLSLLSTQRAEFMVEGPLSKQSKQASFLLSLRTSLGNYLYGASPSQQVRDWADPQHSDFNLKIDFGKFNKNEFELFALGGVTSIFIPFQQGALRDKIRYQIFENEDFLYGTKTAIAGFKHTYRLNSQLFFRNIIAYSYQQHGGTYTGNVPDSLGNIIDKVTSYKSNTVRQNINFHTYLQGKSKNKFYYKTGLLATLYGLNTLQNYILFGLYDANYKGNFLLSRAYAQTKYIFNRNFSLFAGLNAQHLTLNKQFVVEPRLTFAYSSNDNRHSIGLGAGVFNQMQQMQSMVYAPIVGEEPDGSPIYDNYGLTAKFMRSNQLDLEYKFLISTSWRLKMQAYAQFISNTLVSKDSSYYSGLNTGISFFDSYYGAFENGGKGRNMGLEMTVEKFFNKGIYLLFTGSVFDAQNYGSDSIWRNSAFNNRYIANFLIGKEFIFGYNQQHVFFVDMRFSTHGGKPYTPIDVEATYQQGLQNLGLDEILIDSLYNARRTPAFYQVDLKVGVRLNDSRRKISHNIRVDLFNVFDIRNIFTYRYSQVSNPFGQLQRGFAQPIYQRGFIPDLTYFIQF